ncbi:hypothetical protein BDV11DRAFT_200927 [Aspergillus similis]
MGYADARLVYERMLDETLRLYLISFVRCPSELDRHPAPRLMATGIQSNTWCI